MADHKYAAHIAQREVRMIRSPQGDTRNMRILLARGLRFDVACTVVEKIRSETVGHPDTYAWEMAQDEDNLDSHYLQYRATKQRFRERLKGNAKPIPTPTLTEENAFVVLGDRIRDEEVRLPKPKKKSRKRAAAKPKGPKAHATPARDRAAREAMKELRK